MLEMKKALVIMVMLAVLLGMTVPSIMAQTSSNTMLQNLAARPEFSNIVSLAKTAGLDSALSGGTQYTLFAPTNNALAKVPADSLKALANNKPLLSSLLNYNVVPGKLSYSSLLGMKSLKTVDGRTLPVTATNGVLSVGGVNVPNQGIDSSNGMIYPLNSLIMPPGFAMPQVSQSTGLSLGWLPWLIGALILAGIAYYLLSRRRRAPEVPRRTYAPTEPPTRYETRPVEEPKRAEETIHQVRESVSTVREPQIADIAKNLNLPLSGDALKGFNMLIDRGTFKNKQDFISFLAKTYTQNDVGSMMSEGIEPHTTRVLDIIHKSGIAKNLFDGDIKKYLVPLFLVGFKAIHDYTTKKPAPKVM